jgi:NhaA family Na+:H+ antiporter
MLEKYSVIPRVDTLDSRESWRLVWGRYCVKLASERYYSEKGVAMIAAICRFLKLEAAGGIMLMLATLVALLLSNSAATAGYQALIQYPIGLTIAHWDYHRPLLWWINDGLMTLFFLHVGLEVKRELLIGALASRSQAVLPVMAALGGMLLPALIYLGCNAQDPLARAGWAIPVATDIAFSLGVLALLGRRIPSALKVFLLALAIIDDLGVIVIISLFYTHQLSLLPLGGALLILLLLFSLNLRGVTAAPPYLLLGGLLWFCLLQSGIHATLAGVVVGLVIPVSRSRSFSELGPAQRLEQQLHPWVAQLILPLFAFANAGITLQGIQFAQQSIALPLGIILGLVIGKPLGIFSFSWLALRLRWAQLPAGVQLPEIFAVAVLCGIGFTMSMYITTLAFESLAIAYGCTARLAILIGSTAAAVGGYSLLNHRLPRMP